MTAVTVNTWQFEDGAAYMSKHSRRTFVSGAVAGLATVATGSRAMAQDVSMGTVTPFIGATPVPLSTYLGEEINVISLGADPTAQQDSSAAISKACGIAAANGGTVYIPAGNYILAQGVSVSATASFSIRGDGDRITTLLPQSTSTTISIYQSSASNRVSIIDIGFFCWSQSPIASAITISFPSIPSCVSENVYLKNITICSSLNSGAACFLGGIGIAGGWNGRITNVCHFACSSGTQPGGYFIKLSNRSCNLIFEDCIAIGADTGFYMAGFTAGISIIRPTLVGSRVGIDTRNVTFDANSNAAAMINCANLSIEGGEVCGFETCGYLTRVQQMTCNSTHFRLTSTSGPQIALNITDTNGSSFSNCMFEGQGYGQNTIAVAMRNVNGSLSCMANVFSNPIIGLIDIGIVFGLNARQNVVTCAKATGPGQAANSNVVVNNSGNSTNFGSWIGSNGRTMSLN